MPSEPDYDSRALSFVGLSNCHAKDRQVEQVERRNLPWYAEDRQVEGGNSPADPQELEKTWYSEQILQLMKEVWPMENGPES